MTTDTPLTAKHCVPCEGGTAPLTQAEEDKYLTAVPDWQIERTGVHQLKKAFEFKNFAAVLAFTNQVGQLAEAEGHHPNLWLHDYKHLEITLYTHAIQGLSENDFIMAAKINEFQQLHAQGVQ